MKNLPSLFYTIVIFALQRDGWTVIRQKGSHIRLEKIIPEKTLRITVPAHRPIKKSTLAEILKQAKISEADFLKLL